MQIRKCHTDANTNGIRTKTLYHSHSVGDIMRNVRAGHLHIKIQFKVALLQELTGSIKCGVHCKSLITYTSCLMTKPTEWPVRPSKTQISLGISPVWSEPSLSAWRKLGSLATQWVHSEDPAQADQSLRWAHIHFVGFVIRQLIYMIRLRDASGIFAFQIRELAGKCIEYIGKFWCRWGFDWKMAYISAKMYVWNQEASLKWERYYNT